ncbi:MAG: type IV toxin-antitoxin system AbiEi family antitoxin [Actinomycetes bacterium]
MAPLDAGSSVTVSGMLPQSPFTRAEAFDLGLREREWRTLSTEGLIREVVPGFFVDASLPDTLNLRFSIARRAITDDVVVARRSAAWLHGVDVLDHRGFPATPRIETVTRKRQNRPRNGLMVAHVADDLLDLDVTEIDGLRVTTPLRTACDLARFAPRTDALVALDAYLHKGLVERDRLLKHLVRWKKRRGVRQAYATIEIADGRSESGGESRLRLRVLDMGLPRPQLQIPVYDLFGNVRFWLDLGWPEWMLGLEYDGEEFHPEERRAHDEARREWIAGRGWTIRAFRREDIFTASRHFEHEVQMLVMDAARAGSSARRALGG